MKDFESFLESGHAQLEATALDTLKKELFPSLSHVAMKMGLIHLVSSFFTLMACPQFGFRLFFEGHGLMHYFMQAGGVACFALCGGFYLGVTFWMAKLFLGEFEWVVLKKNSVLSLGTISLLSLGVFAMLNGHELTFELGFVWLLGAIVSASVPLLTQVRHRPLLKI